MDFLALCLACDCTLRSYQLFVIEDTTKRPWLCIVNVDMLSTAWLHGLKLCYPNPNPGIDGQSGEAEVPVRHMKDRVRNHRIPSSPSRPQHHKGISFDNHAPK